MKNIVLVLISSLLTLSLVASEPTHIIDVPVNVESSTVKWIGSKISENHEGSINIVKGALSIDHGKLAGGVVTIDMNSIKTTDMSEKYNKKLDSHLKNEDFFNVEEFPFATITILKAVKIEGNMYRVTADLTIKGITNQIGFYTDIKIRGAHYQATANIKIDRTKWNIKYNSGSFFKDLGDKIILDEIEFDVFLLSAK